MLAAESLPEWNARSRADRHGHGCPPAAGMHHSGGADPPSTVSQNS